MSPSHSLACVGAPLASPMGPGSASLTRTGTRQHLPLRQLPGLTDTGFFLLLDPRQEVVCRDQGIRACGEGWGLSPAGPHPALQKAAAAAGIRQPVAARQSSPAQGSAGIPRSSANCCSPTKATSCLMRDRMSEVEISDSVHKERIGWRQDAAAQCDPQPTRLGVWDPWAPAAQDVPVPQQLWGIKQPWGSCGHG